jgi:hypothetical protein
VSASGIEVGGVRVRLTVNRARPPEGLEQWRALARVSQAVSPDPTPGRTRLLARQEPPLGGKVARLCSRRRLRPTVPRGMEWPMAALDDIRGWLALPDFKIPVSGQVEVNVLRASIIASRLAVFAEAGVRDPVPLGDGVHGLLGTITIDTEKGPVPMRLPSVVGGWAAECCNAAEQGMKPFPARVRFRAVGQGVEVTFAEHEPKMIAPVQDLVVFVDESGNTGDAAIPSGGTLIGPQASFALVGVGEEAGTETLGRVMTTIRARQGIHAAEIKGRAMDRRPGLVTELLHALREAGLPLFIEVMDKAYFVATNVVTYVLAGPWLPMETPSGRMLANVMADLLTEHVGHAALVAYAGFARCPKPETFELLERTFRREVGEARGCAGSGDLKDALGQIEEVFDEAVSACRAGAPLSHLLPPPDRSLGGKRIAMLPHVSAFTSLCARVNRFAVDSKSVHVVHDEQSHFGGLLHGYAGLLESNAHARELLELVPPGLADWEFKPGRFTVAFGTSETSSGIQAADILARFLTRRLNAIIDQQAVDDDPALSLLLTANAPILGVGVNIVSTTARSARFWGGAAARGPLRL